MTIDEFNNTGFTGNMFARYDNDVWFVMSVDFQEALFGLTPHKKECPADEWRWCRCENVELIESKVIKIKVKENDR